MSIWNDIKKAAIWGSAAVTAPITLGGSLIVANELTKKKPKTNRSSLNDLNADDNDQINRRKAIFGTNGGILGQEIGQSSGGGVGRNTLFGN